MAHGSVLDKSFSKLHQKRLVYGAFLVCLIIALDICTMFYLDLNPIQTLNLKLSLGVGRNNTLMTKESSNPNQYEKQRSLAKITGTSSSPHVQTENSKAIPNFSEPTSTNNSKRKSTHVQEENTKTIPNFSEPNPTNVKTEEYNPNQPISRLNSKGILIPSVPETSKVHVQTEKLKPICNTLHPRTDVCEISGDVRIDSKASTVLLALPNTTLLPERSSWSIKPYARKCDKTAMDGVRKFQVKMINSKYRTGPSCTRKHSVVGIVFSTSGYSRNHFHDFVDTLVPLYITSREFNGEVKFLVTNHDPQWINKYIAILQKLSKYELIDIDKEDEVHCFPRMIVGLKLHKEFKIDPAISQNSMADFRNLLREAYSLKRQTAIKLSAQKADKIPRLLIISRRRTRSFLNEDEIMNMSRNLGFEVIIAEADRNEAKFARIVNSCDVMMGVHGAGLTNIVFLPEKAVFIQIVPLGEMNWIAKTSFGEPAMNMNLSYLEYKIGQNESSLIQQYPRNHPVLRDPHSISKNGWNAFREVYLVRQNVKLDVGRFRGTLLGALELLHE